MSIARFYVATDHMYATGAVPLDAAGFDAGVDRMADSGRDNACEPQRTLFEWALEWEREACSPGGDPGPPDSGRPSPSVAATASPIASVRRFAPVERFLYSVRCGYRSVPL